jgi:hypothetical protein
MQQSFGRNEHVRRCQHRAAVWCESLHQLLRRHVVQQDIWRKAFIAKRCIHAVEAALCTEVHVVVRLTLFGWPECESQVGGRQTRSWNSNDRERRVCGAWLLSVHTTCIGCACQTADVDTGAVRNVAMQWLLSTSRVRSVQLPEQPTRSAVETRQQTTEPTRTNTLSSDIPHKVSMAMKVSAVVAVNSVACDTLTPLVVAANSM